MKRAAVLLTLTALLAFAPSAFACWKCNTTVGCFGTDVGVPGRTFCEFDGACHLMGFCQGFTDETELAASYTVAAVYVVDAETEKASAAKNDSNQAPQCEPQKAEKAELVVER
jgi:hypothetical protein